MSSHGFSSGYFDSYDSIDVHEVRCALVSLHRIKICHLDAVPAADDQGPATHDRISLGHREEPRALPGAAELVLT